MPGELSVLPELVTLPSGVFRMGSPAHEPGRGANEGPQRTVQIDYVLALGKFPVTFDEWDAARAAGAKLHEPADEEWGRGRRPVINVSWRDAQTYLAFLNAQHGLRGADRFRLPSEAEWEYACRAGSTTRYHFGDDPAELGDYAWFADNAEQRTQPVGFKRANAFGLHDMHGNVFEWCEDRWHDAYRVETSDGYHSAAPDDGSAWTDCHDSHVNYVLRGGAWDDKPPQVLRSADRCAATDVRKSHIGFRVARTLPR